MDTHSFSIQLGRSGGTSVRPRLEQSTMVPRQWQSTGQVAEAAGRRRASKISVVVSLNKPESAAIFPKDNTTFSKPYKLFT